MLYSLSSVQTGVIITLIKNLLNLLKTKSDGPEGDPKNKTSVIKMR